jgi:hypothetical protein
VNAPLAGPFHVVSALGGLEDLLSGREGSPGDLDARLPAKHSLRRASDESKMAVAAAHELLSGAGVAVTDRSGLFVGQQQVSLEYCRRFVDQSCRDGPRMASPMLFADSVANSVATHLSLSLGFRGSAQTFIGTRAAGLQAALAAAEDLAAGVLDQALVVVLGTGIELTGEGYHAIYSSRQRGRDLPPFPMLRGALAFLLRREGAGLPGLKGGGARCDGRHPDAQVRALQGLAAEAPAEGRRVASLFSLAEGLGRGLLERAGLSLEPPESLPESFALDPLLRLLIDSARVPGPAPRTAWCLGEDGVAAWLGFDAALPALRL